MKTKLLECRFAPMSSWWHIILIGQMFLPSVFVEATKMIPLTSRSLLGTGNEIATLNYNNAFSIEDNHRQDFCDKFKSANRTLFMATALNGIQLNVMVKATTESGYFNYDANTGIDPKNEGFYAIILDKIADKGNFTWRNSFGYIQSINSSNSSYTEATQLRNSSGYIKNNNSDLNYTEFIQWGIDNYDILIGDWDITPDRTNAGISFCYPLHYLKLIMITSKEPLIERKVPWLNWLIPFEKEVWFVLLATIFMSCFVYQFIEYMGEERRERSMRQWIMHNAYLSCMNFTQNFQHEPKSLGGRVFAVSFSFWAMLIGAAYTANLASLLVERSAGPGFQLTTIEDAIDRNFRICIETATASADFMKTNYPQADLVRCDTDGDMYLALKNKECEIIVSYSNLFEQYELKLEYNPNCNLVLEGRQVHELYQSFATKVDPGIKCSSLVSEVFNYYLQKMYDDGTLKLEWNAHLLRQKTRDESCKDITTTDSDNTEDVGNKDSTDVNQNRRYLAKSGSVLETNYEVREESLTLRQMAGTFLIPCVGAAFAILCSLLSVFEKKKNVKRHSHKQSSITTTLHNSTAITNINTTASILSQLDCINKLSQENIKSITDCIKLSQENTKNLIIDCFKLSEGNTKRTTEFIQDQLDMMVLMMKDINEKLDTQSTV